MKCPKCRSKLIPVTKDPWSMLNDEQFASVRAGDYYCEKCPDNGRGKGKKCYWWESELVSDGEIIKRQQEEIERLKTQFNDLDKRYMDVLTQLAAAQDKVSNLECTLEAVMCSVDKWLSTQQLKENPTARAANAREIALREIERLNEALDGAVRILCDKDKEIDRLRVDHELATKQIVAAQADLMAVRQALWLLYPDPQGMKYGDDGEMQSQGIDFKRQPISELIALYTKAVQNVTAAAQSRIDDWHVRAMNEEVRGNALQINLDAAKQRIASLEAQLAKLRRLND